MKTRPRRFDPSEALSGALHGDRTDALFFWRKLAVSDDDFETREFLQRVAERVVLADKTKGKRRADKLIEALYLDGRTDSNRAILRWHQLKHEFDEIEGVGGGDVRQAKALMKSGDLPFVADPGKALRSEYAKREKAAGLKH